MERCSGRAGGVHDFPIDVAGLNLRLDPDHVDRVKDNRDPLRQGVPGTIENWPGRRVRMPGV